MRELISTPTSSTSEAVLRDYFHAKDENRPHLMDRVFAPEATLEIVNHVTTITFPAVTEGREAIADVLVRRFGQAYENVYSFYLAPPPPVTDRFSCDWLVAMSEKETKNVRVGCGRYDWTFEKEPPHLAVRLVITIKAMQVLPPAALGLIVQWLGQLSYPWSSAIAVTKWAPHIELLAPVLEHFSAQ